MIDAGKLKKRIKFYSWNKSIGGNYPKPEELNILRTCYADVRQVSAREQIKSNMQIVDQLYTIKVRLFHGLTSECYVYMNDAWYGITSMQIDENEQSITVSAQYDPRLNLNKGVTS